VEYGELDIEVLELKAVKRSGSIVPQRVFALFLGLVALVSPFAGAQCPNNPALTPTPWNHGTGSASYSGFSQAYTVIGTGSDMFGQGVETGFTDSTTFKGNGQIIAEVTNLSGNSAVNTGAGIFIRGDTGPYSDGGLLYVGSSSGTQYVFSARINDSSLTQINSGSYTLPYWLRIQNSGNVLYPAISTNGTSWTLLPALDLTSDSEFSPGSTLAWGLFVWSGSDSKPTTAVFNNICVNDAFTPYPTLTPVNTPNPTGTPSLVPTLTFTRTYTPTINLTPTNTPTPAITLSPTPTPTITLSPTPMGSPTYTPTPPPGVRIWPNPFTPQLSTNNVTHFLLSSGHGSGRLLIADLRRRQVRSIDFAEGVDVQWDGRDDSGSVVRGGVYLYLLESDGTVRRGTVTVMR
jgi:hypothetical protein